MRRGYCIAYYRSTNKIHWLSCPYEKFLEHKAKGGAYMIVNYDKQGNVIEVNTFNEDATIDGDKNGLL